ncbi:GAP family protein [Microbacterium sp. HD4P20]|uniref:GAP family protein n=1 Tax=Microbacterium sp. HD4P20 TaxID=2864874 RepID=UPI001C63E93B|nr:GAP family protein [Microbacterium sp. HD4P20]MCP2638366.1 GAP family protein [Microbacterium sp. HD4P20]
MELIADAPLALTLVVLALLDGLSIGTLLIPVFLLLAPGRVRSGRVLLYLVTIATFYLAVGMLFTLGLVNLVDVAQGFLSSPAGQVARLVAGAALLLTAILMGTGSKKKADAVATASATSRGAQASGLSPSWATTSLAGSPPITPPAPPASAPETPAPSRITRWRDRLLSPQASGGAVMAVAIAAGLVEVATMLPYLVAMGMLAEAPLAMPLRFGALAAYCAVMILPAIVLLVLRSVAAPLVERPLAKLAAWMERTGRENTAWIIGIVGFLIARGAATELGLFERLDGLLG